MWHTLALFESSTVLQSGLRPKGEMIDQVEDFTGASSNAS